VCSQSLYDGDTVHDALITLTFTIQSNPGVFALLLGSGISRPAQIPTGWEVVVDLVRRVARVGEEDPEPDPIAWYRKKFGAEPGYSDLLARLARSQPERQALLRGYFEPTADDTSRGHRMPTAAHKAIASLVAAGRVRVVVTTNFDRLLERALADMSVSPVVIATSDAILGAPPLQHSPCTIIKVNGDVLDTRIRNTAEELAKYPPEMCQLLDRVFEDYGLIVCGWSAEWDVALRDALSRRRGRRYSCFWCVKDPLGPQSKDLAQLLSAVLLPITDANTFFESLAEKVAALDRLSRPHPLSTALAVEALKEYIVDDRHRIRLHDLVVDSADDVVRELLDPNLVDKPLSPEDLQPRLARYESLSEMIVALMANGVFWDRPDRLHDQLWTNLLLRLARPVLERRTGLLMTLKLLRYPACLAMYAAGVAAYARGRFDILRSLLAAEFVHESGRALYAQLNPANVLEGADRRLPGKGTMPLHQRVFDWLRPVFHPLVPGETEFVWAFYRFEYLMALRAAVTNEWAMPGLYVFRGGRFSGQEDVLLAMEKALAEEKGKWAPVAEGLLPGTVEEIAVAQQQLHLRIRSWREQCGWP
jgi:hypothetical protein